MYNIFTSYTYIVAKLIARETSHFTDWGTTVFQICFVEY